MEWAIVLSFQEDETDECGSSTPVALPQSVWLSRQVSQSHVDSLEVNVKSVMHVVRSHSLENVSIVCALFCKITPGGVPQDMNITAVRSAFKLKIITRESYPFIWATTSQYHSTKHLLAPPGDCKTYITLMRLATNFFS